MNADVENLRLDEVAELPSAVSELEYGTSSGITNVSPPLPLDSAAIAATSLSLDSTASPIRNVPVKRTFSLVSRIMNEIKGFGRLSHEGIMGAGIARDSDSAFKAACRAIVFSVYFEWTILLVIFLNTITMMVKGPDPPGAPSSFASSLASNSSLDALDIVDLCVTIVFTLEALFKIWLQGIDQYLSDNYCRFDLASVCQSSIFARRIDTCTKSMIITDFPQVSLSWVSVVLDTVAPSSTSGLNLSAIRSLRAVRPLRAVRFFPNFRFIVEAAYRRSVCVFVHCCHSPHGVRGLRSAMIFGHHEHLPHDATCIHILCAVFFLWVPRPCF
jgi:hypothetical protein